MILPLSSCPAAPAQGALGIECRAEDEATARLLAEIDHEPTRRAIETERTLLGERGGGCHQRFGATQIEVPELGTLLYLREDGQEGQLRWTPPVTLPAPVGTVRAWDGSRAQRAAIEPLAAGIAASALSIAHAEAIFIAHARALPAEAREAIRPGSRIYVPGLATWKALAAQGLWIEGCADGLGFGQLQPLLHEPLLQLPSHAGWTVLTHAEAVDGWAPAHAIATYRHLDAAPAQAAVAAPPADTTHYYWHSSAQFDRWQDSVSASAHHACGPGKTFAHLQRARVQNLRMFPSAVQWRSWLESASADS
jgi:hypothetical protein